MRQLPLRIMMLVCLLAMAGCASAPATDPRDPNEAFNRGVNSVNRELDHALLRPAARGYQDVVPGPVRTGVSNFFGNLGDVWSAANSLAQMKIGNAAQDTLRFAFNTVFGFAGVLDIAGNVGIERHKEDFGTTLAHWGVPSGPYVVLPVLGPSTVRDALALPLDWIGDPVRYVAPVPDRNGLVAGRAVDARANALPMDAALDNALDSYTFMRDAYLQHRNAQISGAGDGAVDPVPESAPDEAPGAATPAADPQQP